MPVTENKFLAKLSYDLTARFGRGFGVDNLELFRAFHLSYPIDSLGQRGGQKSESRIRELGIGKICDTSILVLS